MGDDTAPAAVVRRFIERGLGAGDLRAIADTLDPDVRYHGGVVGETTGSDDLLGTIVGYRDAFSDLGVSIEDQFGVGEKVCTRFIVSGVHTGDLADLEATGRRIELETINITQVEDGRIVEVWAEADQLSLLEQLGL